MNGEIKSVFIVCASVTLIVFSLAGFVIYRSSFHNSPANAAVSAVSKSGENEKRTATHYEPGSDFEIKAAGGKEAVIVKYKGNSGTVEIPSVIDGKLITEIGEKAFHGCSSLSSIMIPDSIIKIEKYAFEGCSNLSSITIPDSVKEIGEGAFRGCSSLSDITIPDSVNEIGEWAFAGCSNFSSITISNGKTKIGLGAFMGCPIRHYNFQ